MPKRPQLNASVRTVVGRRVKKIRNQSLIPANIFGKKVKSLAVQLPLPDFQKLYAETGETTLIDLIIDGEKTPRAVLVANVQHHPVTQIPLHVDFHQVTLTEKVTAKIPVELIGESPAVKELGGIVVHSISEVEIDALPTDLPDNFTLDISALKQIGDNLTLADISLDAQKITLKDDPSTVLVSIQAPKEEVEEAPTPAEAEVVGEGEAAEVKEGEPAPESTPKPEKSE